MDIYCKKCRGTVLYCSNPARSLPEYGVLRCTVDGCFHQIAICTFCDKKFSIRGYDFRNIKKHVSEHHNIMSGVKDHVDHDGSNNNDGDDFEVSVAPPTIGWPRHGFETKTAEFLKQQRQALTDSGSTMGGLQGLVWRVRHGVDGYATENMASAEDTKMMFNITLLLQSIDKINKTRFLDVMKDLMRLAPELAQPSTGCVRLPTNEKEMTQYITEGSNSIFGQLPIPDMVEIEGHVCIPIDNVVSNHLAMGIDMEYTLIKHPGPTGGQESKTD